MSFYILHKCLPAKTGFMASLHVIHLEEKLVYIYLSLHYISALS